MYRRKRLFRKRKFVRRPRRKFTGRRRAFSRPAKSGNFAPLGTTQKVTMRYCQNITIDPGAALTADTIFSANGVYDPDITGVGHQPYGFDQMMAMYDHATVIGSKITIQSLGTPSCAAYIGIALRDNATSMAGASLEYTMEQAATKMKLVNLTASANPTKVFKGFSMKKFFRGSHVGDDIYQNSNASNPTDQAYFHVIGCAAGTDNPDPIRFMATIDYTVLLSEPKILPTS